MVTGAVLVASAEAVLVKLCSSLATLLQIYEGGRTGQTLLATLLQVYEGGRLCCVPL